MHWLSQKPHTNLSICVLRMLREGQQLRPAEEVDCRSQRKSCTGTWVLRHCTRSTCPRGTSVALLTRSNSVLDTMFSCQLLLG